MNFHRNLILISAIALAFPAGSDCASVPHTKTLSIAVENDLVIIPVRINGLKRTFRFVLDTGAEITTLDAQVSRALGLPRGEDIDVLTVGAQGTVPTVRIQTLQFGPIQIGPISVAGYDLEGLSGGVDSKVDGVLGIDVLRQARFTIDFGKKELSFGEALQLKSVSNSTRVPVRQGAGGYLVPVVLNGSDHIELLLDTGTNLTQLPAEVWKQLTNDWHPRRILCGAASTGNVESTSCFARLDSMNLESIKIESAVVRFQKNQKTGVFSEPNAVGLMGTDVLKRFVVTVDFPNGEVFLSPSSTYQADTSEYTTVGIQFLKRAGAYFVASTWEGSPAELAGVQRGDEIVAIQGRPAVTLSNIGLHNLLHGAPDSRVKLTLRRAGKLKSYELIRKPLL